MGTGDILVDRLTRGIGFQLKESVFESYSLDENVSVALNAIRWSCLALECKYIFVKDSRIKKDRLNGVKIDGRELKLTESGKDTFIFRSDPEKEDNTLRYFELKCDGYGNILIKYMQNEIDSSGNWKGPKVNSILLTMKNLKELINSLIGK